jgi:hypothetical protein
MARDKKDGPRGRNDVYTVMLLITLLAIGIGCTLLYMDYDEYGKTPPPKEPSPAVPKLGEDTKGGSAMRREPPLAPPAVVASARPLIRPGEPAALLPVAVHTPTPAAESH